MLWEVKTFKSTYVYREIRKVTCVPKPRCLIRKSWKRLSFYFGVIPEFSANQLSVEGVPQHRVNLQILEEVCGIVCHLYMHLYLCSGYFCLFVLGPGIQGNLCQNIS